MEIRRGLGKWPLPKTNTKREEYYSKFFTIAVIAVFFIIAGVYLYLTANLITPFLSNLEEEQQKIIALFLSGAGTTIMILISRRGGQR